MALFDDASGSNICTESKMTSIFIASKNKAYVSSLENKISMISMHEDMNFLNDNEKVKT
jgi:hypothetical protein